MTGYLALAVALSVVLLFVHIFLQSILTSREVGLKWSAGPRDESRELRSVMVGRAMRASANFRETYPAFIVLVATYAFNSSVVWLGVVGAWIWLICRIIYLPAYMSGIAYLRPIAWFGSIIGLFIMLAALFLMLAAVFLY